MTANQQSNDQQKIAQQIQAFEDMCQAQTKHRHIVTASGCGAVG